MERGKDTPGSEEKPHQDHIQMRSYKVIICVETMYKGEVSEAYFLVI